VNQAIRAGLSPRRRESFRQRTFDLGFRPDIPYDKALQRAAAIEGEEMVRKLSASPHHQTAKGWIEGLSAATSRWASLRHGGRVARRDGCYRRA